MLSDEEADELASLKYSANMTLTDLACEYSLSGERVVAKFSKRDLSATTVQAAFLNACFFKLNARVAESVRGPTGEPQVEWDKLTCIGSGTCLGWPLQTLKS